MNAILLVQRYAGEPLGNTPCGCADLARWATFGVYTAPAGPKSVGPITLDFIGSDVTADFESSCPWIDWRCSWDSSDTNSGVELMQALEHRRLRIGPVDLAINLDGFNVTQVLASWLRPQFIAGGALSTNLRRSMQWGDKPQQQFLAEPDWDSPLSHSSSGLAQEQFHLNCSAAWPGSR